MKAVLLAVLAFSSCVAVEAQRLPENVLPQHYQLTFTPNLQDATFAGDETIDVRVVKPTTAIAINAAEIKFRSVTIESHGTTVNAKVTTDDNGTKFSCRITNPAGAVTSKVATLTVT